MIDVLLKLAVPILPPSGSCQLHLELTTQDFEEEEAAGLYPFNAARNRAMMLAETEARTSYEGVNERGEVTVVAQ